MATSFFGGEFFGGEFFNEAVATPPLPGGGGKKYRQRSYPLGNLDLKTWQKNRRKLESEIEEVQQKIQAKRVRSDEVSYERKQRILKEIQRLNERLIKLLGELDMVKKMADEAEEEAEVIAVYRAYRSLH